jgi:hypothetical protein
MVLGMIPMGFADSHTAGEQLKDLGLVTGYPDGTLGEANNITRAEMMVQLSRINGKFEEAKSFALPSTFTDVPATHWASPYIAYAELNEWTAGVGGGKYDPNGLVTLQQAAVFMLKSLGYVADVDFNWTNAVEVATGKGLIAGVSVAGNVAVTRGQLFTVMLNTVNAMLKDGSMTLGQKLGIAALNPAVVSLTATGANKLEVKFNIAVDKAKAVVAVTKGSVVVNTDKVEFAADNKSAVITTTTNLTKGDYTVTVTGLTTDALKATVTVDDVKVAKINITSTKAPRLANDNTKATVLYEVLNQYGEKMNNQNIIWTISTGKSITGEVLNKSFIIEAASGDFIPGAIVYVTGVHTATGTVVNAQVEIGLASQADTVVFKGVYNTSAAKLEALPAGFANSKYVLLYEVNDQYGNKMSTDSYSDLVFTSNNPLFISSTFTSASAVTISDVVYQAVNLTRGTTPENGGTATIQAISKMTGKISTFTIEANALAALKTLTLAAPTKLVAEGEKVEIPFTAVDQFGNAVTKFELFDDVVLSPATLVFEKQSDGSAKLFYTAPATGASENADLPVYLTSVVTGGSFSSQMIYVKDEAKPTAVVGLDAKIVTSIAVGNNVTIKGEQVLVQDQYGRTMTKAKVNTWLNVTDNAIKVTSTVGATTPFTVYKNTATTDEAVQLIENSTDSVKISAINVTANTESIKFELSTSTASAKSFTFTKVAVADFASYEIADLGKMYIDTTTPSAVSVDHAKVVKVYGVKADGVKVRIPAGSLVVSTSVATSRLSVSADTISDANGYDATHFADAQGNYKDVTVTVLVTVLDTNGVAVSLLQKDLVLSNKVPQVNEITLDDDLVTSGSAFVDGPTILAADLSVVVEETLDQYGVEITEVPVITITNLTKADGSTFAVVRNGQNDVEITGAIAGDKFTATFKYDGGKTAVVNFTVAAE